MKFAIATLVILGMMAQSSMSFQAPYYCKPVDGVVGAWGAYTDCTKSCGVGGTQRRDRQCIAEPKCGGKPCGPLWESKKCNERCCPANGYWTKWESERGQCTKPCGGGRRNRWRKCVGQACYGKGCEGDSESSVICNNRCCPVNGYYGPWGDYSKCSRPCGGGSKHRSRECFEPKCGGQHYCKEPKYEKSDCNTQCCPADGKWSSWKSAPCSKSCGEGTRRRWRTCVGRACYGKACVGKSEEEVPCNDGCCPVHGYWLGYGSYGECSKSCGGGIQHRYRKCYAPKCGGKDCEGYKYEKKACNTDCCPVHAYYGSYGYWSQCTKTCGGGSQHRYRECYAGKCGGKDCVGPKYEKRDCNTQCCPVNGYWLGYGSYGECSKPCGGGVQHRYRKCYGQKCGGKGCDGYTYEKRPCNPQCCAVDGYWTKWESQRGQCSQSCGGGVRRRWRRCVGRDCGGKFCVGLAESTVVCNKLCCPQDATWGSWGDYGRCSKKCGGGTHRRRRHCQGPKCGGKRGCKGPKKESGPCNTDCCAVDGEITKWGSWGSCTVSCGVGTQLRDRECIEPKCGGDDCNPKKALWERRSCNKGRCPYYRHPYK